MNNDELLKRISSLENRIKELESQKKDSLSMFGRSYSQVGSSNSDFLIKTKGLVKVQWGSKFIDIIKDGKINVDSSFIFKINSENEIDIKDGIYVIDGENPQVWVSIGGQKINLIGEIGTTYVSFMGVQETDSDSKYNALTNIGFLYKDLQSVTDSSLRNGIIYVESELKLYIVLEGKLSKFSIDFPNPFTLLFVIAKADNSKGALVILGNGIENSVAFDSLSIYTDEGETYIDSDGKIYVRVGDSNKVIIDRTVATFSTDIATNMIKSLGATPSSGFRLYCIDGKSVLEIDELIVRNSDQSGLSGEFIYNTYWYKDENIITSFKSNESFDYTDEEASEEEALVDEGPQTEYVLELKYLNSYLVGDILCVLASIPASEDEDALYQFVKIPLKITNVEDEIISVEIQQDLDELGDSDLIIASLTGKTVFYIGDGTTLKTRMRRSEEGIDFVDISSIENSEGTDGIKVRIGHILNLGLKVIDNSKESSELDYAGDYGVYSKHGIFDNALYRAGYILPEDDDSSRFASTEWVNQRIASSNVDINFSITDPEDDLDIKAYFSKPEIQLLYLDLKVGTTVTYVGQFGMLTITKTERDLVFSAIVRAVTDSLSWSHRSINGTYDSEQNVWYGTSSYIIKDLFNPGYYWTKEWKNLKPTSPEYIGTTNTETVSEIKPYILYTNDGKTWKLVDQYVAPNPDLIYFVASGLASCTLEGSQRVPMGFIGIVKSDGKTLVKVGKSNYAIHTFDTDNPETGDIRGNIPKATRTLLINTLKDAVPGVIPTIPGLPTLFTIKASDISTIPENSMLLLKNSSGGVDISQIFGDAKLKVRDATLSTCRWTNSEGYKYNTTHPGTYKSIGSIDFWNDDTNIKILAGVILRDIFASVDGISATEARNSVYSDVVGFAQSYTATHWENYDFFLMKGVCESGFSSPSDDNLGAKAGLKMDNDIEIVRSSTHIFGRFSVTYRDYKWPESPDPNYPYLSAMWAIDEATKVSETNRLPYPSEILLNLIFNSSGGNYKIVGTVGNNLSITPL